MFIVFIALISIPVVLLAAAGLWLGYQLHWVGRSRRRPETGFEYVYVKQDGTVRELSDSEREYLTEKFDPCDGDRPYIKSHYEALDGGGKISGFIMRRQVPEKLTILPINSH